MVKYLFIALLMFSSQANAAPVDFKIAPGSFIKFEAVQNGAKVEGEFKKFSGNIKFDPNDLAASSAKITIDMASVNASYAEVPKTLKEADWFNVSKFPSATFESVKFTEAGHATYENHIHKPLYDIEEKLTIKGVTLPVTIKFVMEEFTPAKAVAVGHMDLSRTKYNVGWKDVSAVKDPVRVEFKIVATGSK